MSQKKYKKQNKTSKVSDVTTEYLTDIKENKIVISSFEEQENDNYNFWISLTPIQRLQVHYKLITTLYKKEIEKNKKKKYKRILFDEYPDR